MTDQHQRVAQEIDFAIRDYDSSKTRQQIAAAMLRREWPGWVRCDLSDESTWPASIGPWQVAIRNKVTVATWDSALGWSKESGKAFQVQPTHYRPLPQPPQEGV